MVEEAPRGRHQDIQRPHEELFLRRIRDPAYDRPKTQVREPLGVHRGGIPYLGREFARGGQHQRPGAASGGGPARLQPLQGGQQEGRGLAGPGLGAGHDVATGEYRRNRARLNGGGLFIAGGLEGIQQRGSQIQ